jgi:flagellar basal body rod protein FlgC
MNAVGTAAMGLMAAGARLFSSASPVALAQSIRGVESEPPFLPLQAVQAAARQAGVGASSRRGFASGPVIKWPVQPWEQGGVSWSAGDLARNMLNLTEARTAFRANLAVFQAADEMEEALLDITV